MEELQQHYVKLKTRVAVSIALYSSFAIGGVVAVITERTDIFQWLILVGVVAIFVLPRQAVPRTGIPDGANDRELLGRLARIRLWLSYLRAIYLLGAIFILFGLPEIL